ncbi:MAG: transglycosylase SLT domain-containing protein [Magnetococcus sp. DMHC-8]
MVWMVTLMLLWSAPVRAKEIYSFVDKHGVLHLTDRPNDARYRPVQLANHYVAKPTRPGTKGPAVYWTRDTRQGTMVSWVPLRYGRDGGAPAGQQQRFREIILTVAQQTGLQSALLHSIIRAESNFDPDAVSPRGAVGLMQLMPATARQYGVMDITDPATNVHGGARFLADLLKQFNNNLELSLAAYNAGPTTVIRYGGMVPPYPETRQYVDRVLRYYQEYQQVM